MIPEVVDLVNALRRAGITDIGAGDLDRALYAADASLYRVLPQVVVRPRHTDELAAVLAVAREVGTSLTMRGAGTSIAGNAVGPGIVVDTSRHLTAIHSLDADAGLAVVEPGVVHADLQRRALAAGWRFGPDPSTHTRCTIGGMIGNNACGSRALGYGRTSDNVEALDVVWGTGEQARLGPGLPLTGAAAGLAALVAADLGHVRTQFGRFSRQVSGYSLEHLLPERLRPERFVVGSEGTLALVTSATVRLVREAPVRHLVVLGYPSMIAAADVVPGLLEVPGLVACEGLDARIVALVPSAPELPRGSGWLFAEMVGDDLGEVAARVRQVIAAAEALEARVVTDLAAMAQLWRIREDGAGLAARSLTRPAHSGWEDAAVPPEKLGAWLREFDELLSAHGLDGVPYGHFGDGCVHVRIDFDFSDGPARFRKFLTECATSLAAHGGSLSGEHGDGRARSELLPLMYDERSLALMAGAKAIADPARLLNPGVLVDPSPFDADLRPVRAVRTVPGLRLIDDLAAEAHRCTGVGTCVSAHAPGVMCPSWQATRDEKDSTRGRARVLQEAMDAGGTIDLDGDEVAEALDLCLSCKGCASDCPTGVDMAVLKSEVLHARHRGLRGWLRRPRTHHTLGRLPALLDSPLRRLLPMANGSGPVARLAKTVAGVDQRRGLPELADSTLRSRSVRRSPAAQAERPDVWIWADTFTDHFGPRIAEAAQQVLASIGLTSAVIDARACCGLTYISTGQLDAAGASIDALVATLTPYAASGTPILGLEPSCAATLRSDALRLATDKVGAQTVADAVVTLAELLTRHDFAPPDLSGLRFVAQPHCHQHAVLGWEADQALLRAAGAEMLRVAGCCGLAGTFGVERGHHEISVAVADTHLLPALRAQPDAVVLADGLSCRTQIADLAGREALHLAEVLARRLE